MSSNLQDWTDAYDEAPSTPPHCEALIAGGEYELRAIGCALKLTGWPVGPMSAAAGAGVVLAGLRTAGWDVVRRSDART
jgi:hypothetical protein